MLIGMLVVAVVAVGLAVAPDVAFGLVCTAPENLPCRPLTLECLFVGAGGVAAGLPAVPPGWGGFPEFERGPAPDSYDESDNRPQDNPRTYAPEPIPGYQPPRPPSPQDALNDPAFERAKQDWARENSDRFPTTSSAPSSGDSAYDTLVKSIQNK